LRAIAEEADLARQLAEEVSGDARQTAEFPKEATDRAGLQADQIRAALASTSDLIEPAA